MDKKFEERINEVKSQATEFAKEAKTGAKKVCKWVKENPKEAVAIVTGLATGIGFATRGIVKVGNMVHDSKEQKDLKKRIWNPVAGEYLYTKKPLTGKQKLEFEERIASGEPRAAILKSMGLLDMDR